MVSTGNCPSQMIVKGAMSRVHPIEPLPSRFSVTHPNALLISNNNLRANMLHLLVDAMCKTCTEDRLTKTWSHSGDRRLGGGLGRLLPYAFGQLLEEDKQKTLGTRCT
eukprot:897733-Amphidinium_carterae.2